MIRLKQTGSMSTLENEAAPSYTEDAIQDVNCKEHAKENTQAAVNVGYCAEYHT